MEEVMHYLELKNQYYEKFYQLTMKFMEQAEKNQWADIDLFVDNRDRILNIINSFDHKIAKRMEELHLSEVELRRYKARVKELIAIRQVIAEKIFASDLELMGKIDDVKSETIRELKQTVETTNQINAFSPNPKKTTKIRNEA